MRDDLATASDAALVLSVARFERAALAELYRRHAGAVFGLSRRLLVEQHAAESVVSAVFLQMWHEPERFDPERGSVRSLLLAQAHARSVDVLREDGARRRERDRAVGQVAAGGYDLDRQAGDLAVADHVRRALQQLRTEERVVIELGYFGGRTYREVAVVLDESARTVAGRMRSGLRRLRAELADTGTTVDT